MLDVSTTCVVVIFRVKVSCITSVDGWLIPSTDVIQVTLTLKMTTAQVAETSVTVNNNNSSIQDYVHPGDQTQPTFEMTPGFKPPTVTIQLLKLLYICIGRKTWAYNLSKRDETFNKGQT